MAVDSDTSLGEETDLLVDDATGDDGIASDPPKKVRTRRSKVLRWMAGIFVVMALIALAVGGWGIYQFNQLQRTDVDLAEAGIDEPQNFLIVGSDTRDLDTAAADAGNIFGNNDSNIPGGKRADTLVIARIDPATTSVELLSIPRDLWVENTDGSKDHRRINAAYTDGPQEVIDTIDSELGIPIHHYIEVNFNGFKDLVDAIGGVPMYFDRPVYDLNTGLNIKKEGCYTLDGIQALAYARSRHLVWSNGVKWIKDESGDLGRITRQQVFMRHAAAKITELGLGDVNTLRVLVAVAVNNVTVDDELGTKQMLAISRQFDSFTTDQMIVHRLPITPHRTDGGASVVLVDDEAAAQVLNLFSGIEPPPPDEPEASIPPEEVTIDVFNATAVAGLASQTMESLAGWGFSVGEVSDETPTGRSIVRYAPGSENVANLVANLLIPAPALVEDESLDGYHVQVVLEDDSVTVVPVPDETASTAGTSSGSGSASTTAEANGPDASVEEIGVAPGDPPPGKTCE